MCYDAKSSIMAFLLMIILAVFLLWRNEDYDWIIAAVAIPIALIQLIEWGIHTNSISGEEGGKLLYGTLWLQLLVLAFCVWLLTKFGLAALWLVFILILFLYAMVYLAQVAPGVFTVTGNQDCGSSSSRGNLIWKKDGGLIFSPFGPIYLLGVTLPFLFLLAYYGWGNWGLWLLLAYVLLSAIFVYLIFGGDKFGSQWCYVVVGFFFLAWLVGIFRAPIACV